MPAPFRPWANSVLVVAAASTVLAGVVLTVFVLVRMRMPAASEQGNPREQPVAFDHRRHVGEAGIDCRYCHDLVERSAVAGVPPTARCMNCHAQVRNQSPLLDPVRKSFFSGVPIAWSRVHRLPGFVYFDHSIHVRKGVACSQCHGPVEGMARVFKVEPMTMGWCLDCHREVAGRLDLPKLMDCSACHR
jgi:hypothetical protein